MTGGKAPVHEQRLGRGRDHLYGVEARVEQLDHVRFELGHPVRPGEAKSRLPRASISTTF